MRLDVDPTSGRGFLTGDAVNTAARLEAAAPPMAVLVGALTRDLSHGAIEYERLSPVAAKGKAEPVPAWIARHPLARTGLRTAGFTTTPFLGREREISALHDMLREAAGASQRQIALLVGEPGVGKAVWCWSSRDPWMSVRRWSPGVRGVACRTERASLSGPWERSSGSMPGSWIRTTWGRSKRSWRLSCPTAKTRPGFVSVFAHWSASTLLRPSARRTSRRGNASSN